MNVRTTLSNLVVESDDDSVSVRTTAFGDVGPMKVIPRQDGLVLVFDCMENVVTVTLLGDLNDDYPAHALADRLRSALDAFLHQPIAA